MPYENKQLEMGDRVVEPNTTTETTVATTKSTVIENVTKEKLNGQHSTSTSQGIRSKF